MDAALYLRMSQDQTKQEHGIDRQREQCLELANSLSYNVVHEFSDNDTSAYSGVRRPGYEALIEAMRAGEIQAVVAWHVDRLTRSMKDLETLIDAADAGGVTIRTVQGGDLDLSTASGRMLARILGSVARQESEHHAERRRAANDQRAARGEWRVQGKVPFGYTKAGESVPDEAHAIREGLATVISGGSLRSVARDWNERGFRTRTNGTEFKSTTVKRILLNPRYAALVVHRGEIVGEGAWEAIVDRDDQLALEAMSRAPERAWSPGFERKHQGSGVYLCGVCDAPLIVHYAGERKSYACPKFHVRRSRKLVDQYIDLIVILWLYKRQVLQGVGEDADSGYSEAVTKRDGLQARVDQLGSAFASGDVTIEQMKRATKSLQQQISELDAVISEARRGLTFDGLTSIEDCRDGWWSLSPDMRAKFLRDLLVVKVLPAGEVRGKRGLDPAYLSVAWAHPSEGEPESVDPDMLAAELAAIEERMGVLGGKLADMGISPADAEAEWQSRVDAAESRRLVELDPKTFKPK